MPVQQQVDALRHSGVEVDGDYAALYVDRLPDRRRHRTVDSEALVERGRIIADLRTGGRLVVSSLDRLGVSAGDIRAVLDALIDRGCAVFDIGAAIIYDASTPRGALSAATLAAEATLRAERIRKAAAARQRRVASGERAAAGGRPSWQPGPEVEAAARRDWQDTTLSQAQVAERHGVSSNTLRRRFGGRDAPNGRKKQAT